MLRAEKNSNSRGNKAFVIYSAMIMALFTLVLAACGSNVGGQGQATTPTTVPSSQVQKCGTVHTLHSQIVSVDENTVKQTENCFWQAFQQCQPATLTYANNELDTGTVNTFILKNTGGKCAVSVGVQQFVAPHPPGKSTIYACSSVKLQSDGLYIFSCGDAGTVFIPSK
ncbi:MAG: hypothetical protein ACXVCM_19265 [Ktedonobacteraceae bacterium]